MIKVVGNSAVKENTCVNGIKFELGWISVYISSKKRTQPPLWIIHFNAKGYIIELSNIFGISERQRNDLFFDISIRFISIGNKQTKIQQFICNFSCNTYWSILDSIEVFNGDILMILSIISVYLLSQIVPLPKNKRHWRLRCSIVKQSDEVVCATALCDESTLLLVFNFSEQIHRT